MLHVCPNFRDVGATVNAFAGSTLLRERALLRGGKLDFVDDLESIGSPRFIVNLRRGPDPDLGVPTVQLAADDRLENYSTDDPAVRRWVTQVLDALTSTSADTPVLVHCAAGRDRTGVVIAAVLTSLGIPDELIVADYLMSDGVKSEAPIGAALAGLLGFRSTLARYRAALASRFAADPQAQI
jgi:protein-tyrosine phosphatase